MSVYRSSYDEKLSKAMKLFPYESPNTAQNKIIQQILALNNHQQIFIESPTGSGKSIASLTALLTRLKDKEKIIIFTRTVSQMEPILREWGRIYSYHQVLQDEAPLILPMLGKSRLCKQLPVLRRNKLELEVHPQSVHVLCKTLPCMLHPEFDESGNYQVRSGKHKLKKMNMKITGSAKKKSPPIDDIVRNLNNQPYCGYYGLRSMTRFATIIVATYPYLKEPLLSILLKSMDTEINQVHVLIDEAHNLIETSETALTKEQILTAKGVFGPFPVFSKLLASMNFNRQISANDIASENEYNRILKVMTEADPSVRRKYGISLGLIVQPDIVSMTQFLKSRHNGRIYTSPDKIKIIQPTPVQYLQPLTDTLTLVLQSGTFSPIDTYKRIYGMRQANQLVIDAMRDHNRFAAFTTWKGMTSKFTHRGETQFKNMAETIIQLTNASPRHVLVICPSYKYLDQLVAKILTTDIKRGKEDFTVEAENEDLDIQE
ncbi:MAG: DEAD/DEAH box helicase, partial [Candidatus Kariarchaeaceae archaeon]